MQITDINPFVRYAKIQPSIVSAPPLKGVYDHRIFYVLEGNAEFAMSDQTITVSSGTLIYLPAATPYYFNGNIKTVVLNFDMTQNFNHLKKSLPRPKNMDEFCHECVLESDIPEELKEKIIIYNAFDAESSLIDCVGAFIEKAEYYEAEASATVKKLLCYIAKGGKASAKEALDLVRKISVYLQQNYDKDVDNESIAREFGYHSYYLNRVLKKSTGETIHQKLIFERISVAKKILKNTDFTVERIAFEVGFSNSSQFCNAFKKHTGLSPSEYRNKS